LGDKPVAGVGSRSLTAEP